MDSNRPRLGEGTHSLLISCLWVNRCKFGDVYEPNPKKLETYLQLTLGVLRKDIEYINNKLWKIQDVEDGRKATNPTKGRPAPGTRKAVLAQQQAQPSLLSYFAQKMREQHEFVSCAIYLFL